MSDDRLDRLERMIGSLVDTVQRDHDERLAEVRKNDAEHAEFRRYMTESREDIERLYRAWPDHFREGHGQT